MYLFIPMSSLEPVSGNQNRILLRIRSFNLNPAVCHFGATNQNQNLFSLKEGSAHLNWISASFFSPGE